MTEISFDSDIRPLNLFDHVRHNPPHLEVVLLGDFDGREGGVVRHQVETAVFEMDALEGELPVDEADRNLVVGGLQRLVDHHDVAVLDAHAGHAVAGDAGVEGRSLVLDDVAVKVEHGLGIVLRRGRKPGVYALHDRDLVVVGVRCKNIYIGHTDMFFLRFAQKSVENLNKNLRKYIFVDFLMIFKDFSPSGDSYNLKTNVETYRGTSLQCFGSCP